MRILFVVHGFPPCALGGTEVYTHDLARALVEKGDEVFVLAREADPKSAEFQTRTEDQHGIQVTFVNNTFRNVQSFEDSYRCLAIRRIGAAVVDRVRPDVVHVQHLTCLSTDLVYEFAERHLPTFLTLHDYWLICHRGQLFDLDGERCDGPFGGGCGRCVGAAGTVSASGYLAARAFRSLESRLPAGTLDGIRRTAARAMTGAGETASAAASLVRLSHMREVVGHLTHVLAPSATVYERFLEFGIPPSRMTRWELGIDATGLARKPESGSALLRIGFMGSLIVSKAPHLLLEAFAGLPAGSATLDLFGSHAPYHGDDGYRARLEPLLARPGVTTHGSIPHEQVGGALSRLDVLVLPSVWLENSPLVIREAFAAGVPVVTANLGGMAESVVNEQNGLLFEPGSAGDLRRCLLRLIEEPGLVDRLRAGIPKVRTIEEDAASLRDFYRSQLESASARTRTVALQSASPTSRIVALVLNYRTPEQTFLAVRSLQGSRAAIDNFIVIDNGSGDDSVGRLSQLLPHTPITTLRTNVGFSAGCNVGIRSALERGADFVLLVNSDAVVPPDTLGQLVRTMATQPRIGIVGPVLLSRQFPNSVASAGITFSMRSGRMLHREFGTKWKGLEQSVERVDGVSGCVMLVRRDVFEQAGQLDDRYFFSFEDLEFCLRARRAGFETAIDRGAVAYHEGGASIQGRSARRIYFATRNHLLLAKETPCPGGPLGALLRNSSIVAFNAAFALTNGEVPRASGLGAVFRGIRDHAGGWYGGE